MDEAVPIGQFSALILRTCFALVFVGIVLWHVSVLHTTSRTPPNPETTPDRFSTPRTLYSGKVLIGFDWPVVHGLAHQRISQLERDFWESSTAPDGLSIAQGCSSLYPSHSPASSCWQEGGWQEDSAQRGQGKKPMQVKVSFLEVPRGETPMSAMSKRMQEAVDQATIEAQTDAVSRGLSGSQAQHFAEAHRQQLLQSNPEELAAQQLPTFDLENLDLQSLFPEMLGHGDNSERLAAFSGMVRSLIEQLEATVAALGDYDDEYEEPSLEEASADDQIIERAYTDIKDMLPVTLHGQPACPVMPRLAPIPRNIMMSPWPPIMKQLFSEFSEFSRGHNGDLGQPSSAGLGSMGSSGASEKDRWDFQAGESAHPDASSDDITAVVEEAVDVGEVWEAGNAVQESIEAALKTATLPAMPDAQSYGTQRLQQVSEMSRRIEDEYHKLFLQRARAKRLLFEKEVKAADAYFASPEFIDQLNRIHAITKSAMGPDADELEAMDLLWRELVHMATVQTRTIACMSAGGQDQQCYNQAAYGSAPPAYEPFEALTAAQQQEFSGYLEGLYNASVPRAPVRLPVLHWDARVDGTAPGQKGLLKSPPAPGDAKVWVEGRGEPRQDAWQLREAAVGRQALEGHPVVRALQAHTVQRYLLFQVQQMLGYIEEWGYLMEPEQIRELLSESRLSRATDEMRSPDSQKPGVAASSEELFAQLREKLLTPTTRSEERGREEG